MQEGLVWGASCSGIYVCIFACFCAGKARRLKQAKDEALAEVENYRQMRENGFKNKQTGVSIYTIHRLHFKRMHLNYY